MAIREYEALRFESASAKETVDPLSVEEALQITINGEPFTVTMRTPGDDRSLVRGILHSEGVLIDTNHLPEIQFKKERESILTEATLEISSERLGTAYTNSRSLLSVSSCGICGKTELEDVLSIGTPITRVQRIDMNQVLGLFGVMRELQWNFDKSGGTHAAVAFDEDGRALSAKEDIGRHNAVDKVVGHLIHSSSLKEASFLTVSGRISYEIVIKCFKAGIPFLAAVSAHSSLAVDYAKELGITLFAFCRDERATCYANAHRVQVDQQISVAN